jgi:hypothetical protein
LDKEKTLILEKELKCDEENELKLEKDNEEYYDFNEFICEIDKNVVTLLNFDDFLGKKSPSDLKN